MEISSSKLPTKFGDFKVFCFKDVNDETLVITKSISEYECYIRIHSECMTGDVFSSLRCDCGDQLKMALKIIGQKNGILIYMRQEGRGIGLFNKIKSYELQDTGSDTVEANNELGFEGDLRSYEKAIQILQHFNVKSVNLITNNPKKVEAFKGTTISVSEIIPIVVEANENNSKYLATKKNKMDHLI